MFSTCPQAEHPKRCYKLAFLREEGGPRKWWKERAQLKIMHKLKIEELKFAHIKINTYLKLSQTVKLRTLPQSPTVTAPSRSEPFCRLSLIIET